MKSEAARAVNKPPVHVIFGDLLGAAASAALLARLFGVCDDDLRRLRARIHMSPRTAPDLLDWLDHVFGWEQDRRAGYAYPLRGPLEAIPDDELTNSIAAVELLAITFSGEAQVIALLNLVRIILPLNRPNASQATGVGSAAPAQSLGRPGSHGTQLALSRAHSDRRAAPRRASERSEIPGSQVGVERRTRGRRVADEAGSNTSGG